MVLKGFEGSFNGSVKEFKKVLDHFSPKAPVVVNGSVDIICKTVKDYGPFGVTILPTSSFSENCKNSNELFAVLESLNNPPKDNAYMCVRKELQEFCTEEEIDNCKKSTVGELIDTLETIPSECEVMYTNIIVENTNGALNGRFNVPFERAVVEYVPLKNGWDNVFHAIAEDVED